MKRIDLPTPIFFAWLVLTIVLMVQGMRLAQDRQADLEPHRLPVIVEDDQVEAGGGHQLSLHASHEFAVYTGERPGRLALYQVLPERRLLRWIEDDPPGRGPLLVPLAGLGAGEYVLADAPDRSGAAAQEMDRPDETVPARARFTVLPD